VFVASLVPLVLVLLLVVLVLVLCRSDLEAVCVILDRPEASAPEETVVKSVSVVVLRDVDPWNVVNSVGTTLVVDCVIEVELLRNGM
jgi:hypothetical protein